LQNPGNKQRLIEKRFSCWKEEGGGEKEQIAMAMAVAPVSRLSSAHSIYISHISMSSSNRYLNLAFSSSSKHASSQASLMTEYSFSSRRVVARSPQAAMATISQNAHRIAYTMANLKVQGKVALIPYLTAGDPDLDTTAEAMQVLDMCGCDIIELGVPYSDPLADGPVIQVCCCVTFSFLSFEIAPSVWFL
jgi:hypothetical protein